MSEYRDPHYLDDLKDTQREVHEIRKELSELKTEIVTLRSDIQGLIVAWNTANGMVSFLKWVAASALMIFALWDYIKVFFRL